MEHTFARAARWSRGYHVGQVEAFLVSARRAYEQSLAEAPVLTAHQVRTAGFDLVRHGYDVGEVDAALDRLEDALAGRERQRGAAGGEALRHELATTTSLLLARLDRPEGARFPRGAGWECSYDVTDVDELCQRVRRALERSRAGVVATTSGSSHGSGAGVGAGAEGGAAAERAPAAEAVAAAEGGAGETIGATPDEVRRAVFRRRRGRRGYREAAVDAYLDHAVHVLLSRR